MSARKIPDSRPSRAVIDNWHAGLRHHPTLSHDLLHCHRLVRHGADIDEVASRLHLRYWRIWAWEYTPQFQYWELTDALRMAISAGAWSAALPVLQWHAGAYEYIVPLGVSVFACDQWEPDESTAVDAEPPLGARVYSNLAEKGVPPLGLDAHTAIVVRVPAGATWDDVFGTLYRLKDNQVVQFAKRHVASGNQGNLPEIARYVTLYRLWWRYSHDSHADRKARKADFVRAITIVAGTAGVRRLDIQHRAEALFEAAKRTGRIPATTRDTLPRRLAWFLNKNFGDLTKDLGHAETGLEPDEAVSLPDD